MMTTGYDCEDILNICLLRPIFSPTDFIQIKGRGTRTYDFSKEIMDPQYKQEVGEQRKARFKLFDFFAICEYFETEYNYDEILTLPRLASKPVADGGGGALPWSGVYEYQGLDHLASFKLEEIGQNGMRIDRMYFEKFQERLKADPLVADQVKAGDWEAALRRVEAQHFDQPEEFFNLEKLRKAVNADRRLGLRELVEFIFGLIPYIKTRSELLEDEFEKFDTRFMPPENQFYPAKNFFKTYLLDPEFRLQVDLGNFAPLIASHAGGEYLRNLSADWRRKIVAYVQDYVPLNQFAT